MDKQLGMRRRDSRSEPKRDYVYLANAADARDVRSDEPLRGSSLLLQATGNQQQFRLSPTNVVVGASSRRDSPSQPRSRRSDHQVPVSNTAALSIPPFPFQLIILYHMVLP